MGGVSGAFLLLPFQMSFLGYVNPLGRSATNQLFNIVAIPSGVYRRVHPGRPHGLAADLGGHHRRHCRACSSGPSCVAYLPDSSKFKAFAALVLMYIGARMVRDLVKKPGAGTRPRPRSASRSWSAPTAARARRSRASPCPPPGSSPAPCPASSMNSTASSSGSPPWASWRSASWWASWAGCMASAAGPSWPPSSCPCSGCRCTPWLGPRLMGTFITSVAGVTFYQITAPFYLNMSVLPRTGCSGCSSAWGAWPGCTWARAARSSFPPSTSSGCSAEVILYTAGKYALDFLSKALG